MTDQQQLSLNQQAVEPVTITSSGITPPPETVATQQTVVSSPARKKFLGARESLTLSGHTSSVTSVSLSADSRFALSGGFDGTVKLWDLQAGRSLGTFSGHASWVNSVCLSHDGKLAVSGSSDDTLKLWNAATGDCISTFKHHPSEVTSVCLSPDNRLALCGTDDGKLHIWDVANELHLRTLPRREPQNPSAGATPNGDRGHSDEVTSVCVSYDGQFALSGSKDNTIILWEIATGKQLRTFAGHTWVVNSVCLSADSRLALSGSSDGSLHLWDLATGAATSFGSVAIGNFKGHTSWVTSVSLSADGQFALSGSGDSTLKLWEVTTGLCLHEFEGHSSWVNSVCLSPDAKFALSGSDDNTLKLWVLDWKEVKVPDSDWDEGARPYLETFLTLHTPYAGTLPSDRAPTEEEITAALTRFGTPSWNAKDFGQLLLTLERVGYGWLRPSGVRSQLMAMASGNRDALRHRGAINKGKAEPQFAPTEASATPDGVRRGETAFVTLTVVAGELEKKEYSFTERATCIIGRAKDCHILIPDSEIHRTISRYHCLLDINPPQVRVRDFGSLNGTYINGVKIGQRPRYQNPNSSVVEEGEVANLSFRAMLLQDGDEIRVGNTVFRVKILPSPLQDSFIPPGAGESPVNYTSYSESEVALKILHPQTVFHPSAIEQFLSQMANAKALQHRYLNPILDVGYRDGIFFIAYPLQGGSVEDLMQAYGGTLTPDVAVPIVLQLLDALEYAHNAEVPYLKQPDRSFAPGRGWAHGDIQPNNILLVSLDGNPNHLEVKLSDYGVARSFDQAGLNGLSVTDPHLYSPYFLPRQQAINFQSNLSAADIWAVAACLYYMLTGTYPRNFDKKDPWLMVLQTQPVPVLKRLPSLPQPLADLIDLALVDYPRMRFTRPGAFKQALESIL
ncbi:MAG TPA: FHA domain-containing protein [Oscillatoriaceae cyanobacterium M33_DOE_052]|uniref:FHA domain-containing protein n=1 Tax=Planktothricoides sp. SpSt-374 TaxID=2282167 RepID=A0A7C3ZYF9_9CYAN|nr:FHA domain-containing protein [Oscillatoriaceae cyanobacterium M33_DOE_052]